MVPFQCAGWDVGTRSQRTSRMRLGLAVGLPPRHRPLHTAVRLATLDILSRGRVALGLGRSGSPDQMVTSGTDLADATGIVEEGVTRIPSPARP